MSSNPAHPSNSFPAVPDFSFANTIPSLVPYPVIPKLRRDGVMGQGRPCEVCSKVIGLGTHGSLHAYNLHVEACQKKRIRSTTRQPERAISLPVAVSMATVPNGIHQFTSLSPLIIGRHLHASLSPTPSPTSSPTSLFQPGLFDPGSGSDNNPPTPIQANSVPLPNNTNPAILINPPSDDLSPPTITLYSPQSHQMAPVDAWNNLGDIPFPQSLIREAPMGYHRISSSFTPPFTFEGLRGAVGPGGYATVLMILVLLITSFFEHE
ncbi:hypothetical protein BJ322DRAFT_1025090 [Thelephora terrestris]|uniref:Uncharacterized protein n=1 Tax=Thelephora terrestris TaxID=56493 RepID=A0A9P6H3X4_9AGAM|nr:hypothetical protein BJ322DRAFT_1025090 [Thelephora terrestris]